MVIAAQHGWKEGRGQESQFRGQETVTTTDQGDEMKRTGPINRRWLSGKYVTLWIMKEKRKFGPQSEILAFRSKVGSGVFSETAKRVRINLFG